MGKRYVFWRMPTGQPNKKDDGKFAPSEMLVQIGESATVKDGGGISWPMSGHHQNELAILASIVVLDPDGNELNETDSRSIGSKGINAVIRKNGGKQPILEREFLLAADKEAATLFRKTPREFVLLTSLSIKELPVKLIKCHDCDISGLASRKRFTMPEAFTRRLKRSSLFATHVAESEYQVIQVKVQGRTENEAVDRALDALHLLRGIWTLFSTYGRYRIRMGSTTQESIGVIHTGPVHTIHKPDRTPAADLYWFEPSYVGDVKLFTPSEGWKQTEENRRHALRDLKKHPFRTDVERLVMRYAEALDHTSSDVTLIQLWSILEKITGTIGGNYDETISRAAWVFKDRKHVKQKLGILRMRRNLYVHASRTSSDQENATYLLKSIIEPHLIHLIANDFGVNSLAEHSTVLSLPTNIDTLKKREKDIKVALSILKSSE